jgi:hypothetical protein
MRTLLARSFSHALKDQDRRPIDLVVPPAVAARPRTTSESGPSVSRLVAPAVLIASSAVLVLSGGQAHSRVTEPTSAAGPTSSLEGTIPPIPSWVPADARAKLDARIARGDAFSYHIDAGVAPR